MHSCALLIPRGLNPGRPKEGLSALVIKKRVLFIVIDKADEKRARVYKRATSILEMMTVQVRSSVYKETRKAGSRHKIPWQTRKQLEAVNGVHKHMEGAG
jgi:hypothetical protein